MQRLSKRVERQRALIERLERQLIFERLVLERLEGRATPVDAIPRRDSNIADLLDRARRRQGGSSSYSKATAGD